MDPGPILFTEIQSTAILVLLFSANNHLPHNTVNPLLQQAGEIDNLTVSLGQSTWLCCAGSTLAPESLVLRRTTSRRHQPSTCFLAPPGSINLGFFLRENLPLYASHLPLGVPNGRVLYAYQDCFLAPLPERSRHAARGVSTSNLFTLFLSCFILFTTLFAALYQKNKKISC